MDAPSTPPHEAVKKGAGKGLSALKKLPPWAWILIAGGFILVVIYMRHQASNSSASSAATGSDPSTSDPTNTQGYNDGYDSSSAGYGTGYQQGMADASGGLGGGGMGTSYGPLPNPIGADGGTTIADPGAGTGDTAGAPSTVVNVMFPTGGGAPSKPNVHTGLSVLTHSQKAVGDIALRSGHTKPTAPKGYTVKGTGSGNWIAVKNHPKPKSTKRKGP